MKEPVDHILRPCLPWRTESAITECGYDATKVKTLTRDQFFQRLKDFGQQRTAMFTCMTCSQTANRRSTWEEDPRHAIEREIIWETAWRSDRGHRLKDELQAIAALIEIHAGEFKSLLTVIEQQRIWREKKVKVDKPS